MARPSPDQRDACLAELQRIEEDTQYSSKGHFEAASGWQALYLGFGLPVAIISGVAGVSAFAKHTTLAGVLALVAAGLGAITAFLKPSERMATHHGFGNDYNALRNRARIARTIQAASLTDDQLRDEVVALSGDRDSLNKKAPQVPRWAFKRARRGIEEGEADYAVDDDGST
jgi:hypothetical protein